MAYEKLMDAYGPFLSVAVFSLEVVVGFSEHELRIRQFIEVHPALGLRSDNPSSRNRSNGITVLVFDNLKSLCLRKKERRTCGIQGTLNLRNCHILSN